MPAAHQGVAVNGVPYARLSTEGPPLVVLTGSELEHRPPSWTARQGFLRGLPRLCRQFSVYLLSRRRGLPAGTTARDIAQDVAAMMREHLGAPAHLMGMSSGGSSVLHLAADHPDLVDRLVVAMAAHRLNPHGREVATVWRDLALAEDWPALYQRMGVDVAEGRAPEWFTRGLMRVFGRVLLGRPSSGQDLAAVLDADLNLDVVGELPQISRSTLVIGGEHDPFYGADNIRQTARLIPGAELVLLDGGHAVVKTQTRLFESAVLRFLQGDA